MLVTSGFKLQPMLDWLYYAVVAELATRCPFCVSWPLSSYERDRTVQVNINNIRSEQEIQSNTYTPNCHMRRLHTARGLTGGAWEVSTKPPQSRALPPP